MDISCYLKLDGQVLLILIAEIIKEVAHLFFVATSVRCLWSLLWNFLFVSVVPIE